MQPQQQPVPPVQQPDPNLNFVPNLAAQPVQQPTAPVMPQVDPTIAQLQTDIGEIKTALGTLTTPTTPEPQIPPAQEPAKKYDEWGAVFEDTGKQAEAIVDARLAELQQESVQTNEQLNQQEQQNQQYIDNTVNQLRQAGYLPPINNQFDANDPGKQAENELLGYAVYGVGSTDLVKAAQELKFRHDAGYKYDYNAKNWVQVNQPTGDPNSQMFGNLPQNPDQPQSFIPAPQNFMPPNQPIGPQNPYMAPQYPPGFNAPVSSGSSYMGTQNGVPSLKNIRTNSYDALVEQFNRSQ